MTPKKSKRGRPPVKDERIHRVNVRLNTQELKDLERYMKKHGITKIAPFVRKIVMAKVRQMELFPND